MNLIQKKIIQLLRIQRDILYYFLGLIYFKFKKLDISVMSIDKTIIEAHKKSIIRFGDGEIALINGKSIVYQEYTDEIAIKLLEVLTEKTPNLLICVPDIFGKMKKYKFRDRYFHIKLLYYFRKFFIKYLNKNIYGNTFMSRPYMIFKDKSNSVVIFNKLKELWDDKEIVIVEGMKSKSGIGNNLFDNARKIERLICPSENAFSEYKEIVKEIIKMDSNKLYLFALGPTSKIVISEISKLSYHAIDIGHLDSEYEWSLRNSKNKVYIEGKHTAEFKDNPSIEDSIDSKYIQQIIKYI